LKGEIPIFFLEAGQGADEGIGLPAEAAAQAGKSREELSFCKETFFIHPPTREKSNFLSVNDELSS
jgi:hypothetical protein